MFPKCSETAKQEINVLICLYTCEDHEHLHEEFHHSHIGQFLNSIGGSTLINVFADNTANVSTLRKNNLFVDTQETYTNLSVKTFKMIKFCVRHFQFHYLMKIDLSSGIEHLNLNEKVVNRVSDQQVMVKFLADANTKLQESELSDYSGWKTINANRVGIEQWAKRRGLRIEFDKVFADGKIPPYYSGKCYLLSRPFAAYVADNGAVMAREHKHFLGGSEDLLVGRLYHEYVSAHGSD
jgi:hypothetical protein